MTPLNRHFHEQFGTSARSAVQRQVSPRLLERLAVPRKGLIGPWAHAYPHFAFPGPQFEFSKILRWWDYWLNDIDTGVMDEPMLRAWMTESVKPAAHHDTLPGRWIAEPSWPPPGITPRGCS